MAIKEWIGAIFTTILNGIKRGLLLILISCASASVLGFLIVITSFVSYQFIEKMSFFAQVIAMAIITMPAYLFIMRRILMEEGYKDMRAGEWNFKGKAVELAIGTIVLILPLIFTMGIKDLSKNMWVFLLYAPHSILYPLINHMFISCTIIIILEYFILLFLYRLGGRIYLSEKKERESGVIL